MKKIAALVTTFVLGISGAAMAAPGWRHEAPPAPAPIAYHQPASWTSLESSGSLSRGYDLISVGTRARFSTLKLQASRGTMTINKVVITFANGQKQVVNLDRTLSARSGGATIDLQGNSRAISKIVVQGKGGFRSSYSVLAV